MDQPIILPIATAVPAWSEPAVPPVPDRKGSTCSANFAAVSAALSLLAGNEVFVAADGSPRPDALEAQRCLRDCVGHLELLHECMQRSHACLESAMREATVAQTALRRSEQKLAGSTRSERRARHRSLHDDLTALPNRRHFRERLGRAIDLSLPKRSPLAVLYLDLDGFKPVNDLHGHQVGDALLRIVATRLARSTRAEDLISRVGGDEFACLVQGLGTPGHVARFASDLHRRIRAPVRIGALTLSVGASIGIALCPDDGTTPEVLLHHADDAMYRAKASGASHVFFNARIDA